MAEAIVSFVVQRVGALLIQEAIFLAGVRGQVEQMQTELKQMQSFLKDADKRQDEEKLVKGWISEIRETAYDVEDVIESFVLEVASRRQRGFRKKCKRYATIFIEGANLYKFGKEIEVIKNKITYLTESLEKYGIRIKEEGEASSKSMFKRQSELRRTYSHLVEEHTVGLERNTQLLVEQLVTKEKQRQVSICGMGGLGKTTLANKVYHHDEVRSHFDCFAWACISQRFKPRDIWEGILIKLVAPDNDERERIHKMRHEEIAKELYQFQQKKKCLVILDDIWSVEAWDALNPAFPTRNASSKIVLTTRIKTVALHVNPRGILEPQCLTEEESWELLQKKVFATSDYTDFKIDSDMEEVGRKMVERCAGLPLAINVLGGVLASKHSLDEWKEMHEHIDMHLGRARGPQEQDIHGVQGILALSYHELPYRLKPCFLYLSHFKEDYEIPTKELIRLWWAEGFVPQVKKEAMENVAEVYLHELINRCIIQVGEIGPSGHVKTCRVHDLMRDLCLSMANEDNFFEIFVHAEIEQELSPRVHRLVVYDDNDLVHRIDYGRTSKLRTLFILGKEESELYCDEMITTFKFFKLLRILILKRCFVRGAKLMQEIGYLVHLRYLAINSGSCITFPSSIGNLRYLQTFLVDVYELTMPDVIWKLEQLKHLSLSDLVRGRLLRLGNLKSLQTLQHFDTKIFDVNELANCTNLKKLRIECGKDFEELEVVLRTPGFFNQLSSLRIHINLDTIIEETDLKRLFSCCHHLDELYIIGRIKKLPEHNHFPPNLIKLTLEFSNLKEDPMATLEKLPKLRFLSCYGAVDVNEIVCSSKGFAQLKTLVLTSILEEWRVEEEAMPNLCELHISGCTNLKMLPDGLRFITTLRELKIERMPESFTKRLKVANGEGGGGGEDLYKVKHVPSILFIDY